MRVVAAIDLDAFYCQIATKDKPELADKPVGIRQKYLIVTCNYVARARGVGKLMATEEALKRCPELVVIDGSDLTPFRKASEQISAVLEEFQVPVERLGMDEYFVELTEIVKRRMEETRGVESGQAGELEFDGYVEGDLNDARVSAEDRAKLSLGSHIVREMRDALKDRLGLTCCGGISTSKLGAKLAAELHKPNQQSTFLPASLAEYLIEMPATKIQGLGRQCLKQLYILYVSRYPETMDVTCYRDLCCKHLRRLPLAELTTALQSSTQAKVVFDKVRGVDNSPVSPSGLPKTLSQEETSLPHPTTIETALQRLGELCARLYHLVDQRRRKHGDCPSIVRVSITDKGDNIILARRDRMHRSRQQKVDPIAFSTPEALFRSTEGLLRSCLLADRKFTLCRINVGASDFEKDQKAQSKTISSFFSASTLKEKLAENQCDTTLPTLKRQRDNLPETATSKDNEVDSPHPHMPELLERNGIDKAVFLELPNEIKKELLAQFEASEPKRKKPVGLEAFFKK